MSGRVPNGSPPKRNESLTPDKHPNCELRGAAQNTVKANTGNNNSLYAGANIVF